MESALHLELKRRYGPAAGGRAEVAVGGYRVDAEAADGELVEIQSAGLGALRPKLARLLESRRVRVVRPIATSRRIVRRDRADGPDLSSRRSPRPGRLADAFDDLVGLMTLFPHPRLLVEILPVAIAEIRLPRRRRPGYLVADRRLVEAGPPILLAAPADLWSLLPAPLPDPFTTIDLAAALKSPAYFAQRVAYCLRQSGAARVVGKQGNRLIYRRADGPAGALTPDPAALTMGTPSRSITSR